MSEEKTPQVQPNTEQQPGPEPAPEPNPEIPESHGPSMSHHIHIRGLAPDGEQRIKRK
jgi:hypothetical protein